MSRFNLLDEAWISVVYDERGSTKEVSLIDLFQNAHHYLDLAGDTKTQDFAVLRVLLAVLHTVFSRFDADGNPYDYLEIDDRFRQLEAVDEDDIEKYEEDLYNTWLNLWQSGHFPEIITQYLEKWRDRFYLFDEKFPFFQVRKEDISGEKISKAQASSVSGKNINRTISESANKLALFSPRDSKRKELLNASEVVRWLVTFQGYSGLSDKVIFGNEKYKSSKGWLFDLGAIVIKGKTLFETLLLNCFLIYNKSDNLAHIQLPCWEFESRDILERYLHNESVNNLAELYTNWSRGIHINFDIDLSNPFSFEIVKLPDIGHQDNFLEPMTLWKYNLSGENKGHFTPRKHTINQSLWRSFGLLTITNDNQIKPAILEWLDFLSEELGDCFVELNAISMQDDGNATSWVPTDEIIDSLYINEFVLTDLQENGWVVRINDVVDETKKVISTTYKRFVEDVREIRNISSNGFTTQKVEDLYFRVDKPFRNWLSSIQIDDEKDMKIREWKKILKRLVRSEADNLLKEGSSRDYIGIVNKEKGTVKNIATAYETFNYWLIQSMK